MRELPFHIVDVFPTDKYTGNQLAVIESYGELSSDEMQQIAQEMGYSETTFIESDIRGNDANEVRIFTTVEEIPFAGHPTLGTAFVLRDLLGVTTTDEVRLQLGVGEIPVRFESTGSEEILWMTQQPPSFGTIHDVADLVDVISLDAPAISTAFPIQTVSTGLPTTIIPLLNRRALQSVSIDQSAYQRFANTAETRTILLFCLDPRNSTHDLAVRVFAPALGLIEDPATGSANGNLAGYLLNHGVFETNSVNVQVEQGYEIGRPSLIYLRASQETTSIRVQVGGRVIHVAHGRLV